MSCWEKWKFGRPLRSAMPFFDGAIVIRIEVVDRRHDVAIVQQATAEMAADEAGGSGYEYVYRVARVVWGNSYCVSKPRNNTPGYSTC